MPATDRNLSAGKPMALGFRAERGGGVVVAVAMEDGEPKVVLSTCPATAAEGLAVRDALRFAFSQGGLAVVEVDEKSLAEIAARDLQLSPAEIEQRLKDLGVTAGRPWRKEQKAACLAAWVQVRNL